MVHSFNLINRLTEQVIPLIIVLFLYKSLTKAPLPLLAKKSSSLKGSANAPTNTSLSLHKPIEGPQKG